MVQVIHGVNKSYKNISLSNYSLTAQILIINFLASIIGLCFLIFFNIFLIFNDSSIQSQKTDHSKKLYKISNYLNTNSIFRVPVFDEKCEKNLNKIIKDCENIILSEEQLDPTRTQQYLFQNYLDEDVIIKIFDDSWIKYADTNDSYIDRDIIEIDLADTNTNKNIFLNYKNSYFKIFNYFYQKFLMSKYKSLIIDFKADFFFIRETIKNKINLSEVYIDQDQNLLQILSSPIMKDNKVYGVVLMTYVINNKNNQISLISFNLINLYFVIIFIMVLFSLFFSRSIVAPIKILSTITRSERSKLNSINKNDYPIRRDEIGILGNDILSMSDDLKKQINTIEGFAADVSHELKNPIASLKLSNELLLQNKIDETKKTILLENMKHDINRMNVLISDISSYTLTQVETEEEIFEEFEFTTFFYEFLASYKNNIKDINIVYEEDGSKSLILANKNKFAQILHNLLDNSLSYGPKNSKILITKNNINGYLVVNLLDQGSGIKKNHSDKIFERFYKDRDEDQSLHSGLGLSISRNIIEIFGGTIESIDSPHSSYRGACFELKLPLKD